MGWNRDDCFKGKGGLCKREKGQKKKRERERKDIRGKG